MKVKKLTFSSEKKDSGSRGGSLDRDSQSDMKVTLPESMALHQQSLPSLSEHLKLVNIFFRSFYILKTNFFWIGVSNVVS